MTVISRTFILLVEDNPNDAELVLRALQKSGIEVEVVAVGDGQEALDFLFGEGLYEERDTSDLPGLIMLDLQLPKLRGHDVLQRIRTDARTKLIPVVVFTSSREEEDILGCYEHGANSYIRKPVDFTRFSEVVRQLGLYWLTINEPPPGDGGPA